jgi:cathepsin L
VLFANYVQKYHKIYDYSEYEQRFLNFLENLEKVTIHNVRADLGLESFRVAMNFFADWTNQEFRHHLLGFAPSAANRVATLFVPTGMDVPDAVDWRTKGAVAPVKDQGNCGSCWTFSAVAAMECANFLKTGKLVTLSEQLCVDCVNNGANDCKTGGEMQDCFAQVIKEGGEMSEADYPYKGTDHNKCAFDSNKVAAKFSSYMNVTAGDEQALKEAVAGHVVSVAIDASSWAFQLYSSGVYDHADCKKAYEELDHGVSVVGYDVSNSKPYWIVRNSWGSGWGQKGYIWMARDKSNQCGIATDASFPVA